MADEKVTFSEIRKKIASFVRERDWEQFHNPKNLSMSIAIEAAELMEHFQWADSEKSAEICTDPEKRLLVEEEIADIVTYAFSMANSLNIDLSDALIRKMEKNACKYPADLVRGDSRKYSEYKEKRS